MSYSQAYWILPTGKIYDVNTNHIGAIIKNPKMFKTNKKHIEDTYAKYGERMGQEADARVDLILETLKLGFVRIRLYKTYWAITIDKLDAKTRKILLSWTNDKFAHKKMGMYQPVKLNIASSHRNEREVSVRKLSDGKLISLNTVIELQELLK